MVLDSGRPDSYGGAQGVSVVSPEAPKSFSSDLDWTVILVFFLFAVVGPLFPLAIQALNPYSAEV